MGIEIITSKIELTSGQRGAISRFVNHNCSYYYFLNFILMTNGNVKDAIKLYHFDMELRNIILKQALNLELQMKKKLLIEIYKVDPSYQWDNQKFYIAHFNFQRHGISNFDKMVRDSQKRIRNMNYSGSGRNRNEKMFYATSFGTLLCVYNNLIDTYREGFLNDVYSTSLYNSSLESRFNNLKNYFEAIQFTRNRCAHNNHIINKRFTNKVSRMFLDNFDDECKKFNKFERTLYFLYKKTDSSEEYKKDILKCLSKYKNCLNYCIQKQIFKPSIIDRIQENWKKNL